MKIKLLDGSEAEIQLKKYVYDPKTPSKSQFQTNVGQELRQRFPNDIMFEEVRIPHENFVLDFLIPSVSMAVECHGEQHVRHIKHFHNTIRQFHRQQERDEKKRQWCKLNNIKLIEIYYGDI